MKLFKEIGIISASLIHPSLGNECPTANDVCLNTWGTFRSYFNNTLPCWARNGEVWGCEKVTYNNWTQCQPNQTNVKDCHIGLPRPVCPEPQHTCFVGSTPVRADDLGAPNCWYPGVEVRFWRCERNQECPSGVGMIDISKCPKTIQ